MEYYKQKYTECEIHYDVEGYENYAKIEKFAFELEEPHNVKCTNTGQGPAWEAYIVLRGEDEVETERATKKLVRYIKRFKTHRFY